MEIFEYGGGKNIIPREEPEATIFILRVSEEEINVLRY